MFIKLRIRSLFVRSVRPGHRRSFGSSGISSQQLDTPRVRGSAQPQSDGLGVQTLGVSGTMRFFSVAQCLNEMEDQSHVGVLHKGVRFVEYLSLFFGGSKMNRRPSIA